MNPISRIPLVLTVATAWWSGSPWLGGSESASAAPLANVAVSPSAAHLVAASLAGALRAGSCTNVSKVVAAGLTFGSTTQSGATVASQSVYFNAATGSVRLLAGVLYFKESASLLALQFGVNDAGDANKWISVPASNSHFHALATGLLQASMLSQVAPVGPLTRSPLTTVNGVAVIIVRGGANALLGLTKGAETLILHAQAPYLPIELAAAGRSQGTPTTLTVTFSHWGLRVAVSAPAGAVPITRTKLP